jgi:quercetin dioxygenase-like cupin family protein
MAWRPGCEATLLWTSEGFPVDNGGQEDAALQDVPTSAANGSVFRIMDYAPGVAPRIHRTESLDYGIIISGEICLELEQGVDVVLRAGDVLVQRGTIHNWVNRGQDVCRIAFVLVSAKPVGGPRGELNAVG